ncbi:hypothetical protein PCO31110_04730 [Pandoraea communis]|uniref:Uncharacterized protein n=1 Tax=Pandoraea communis TaxID=2508297 RepID=A0A5E4YPL0_9BURK|nr:hypothetical protein [Pandoraea communis]VVE50721.1 hypothetical protein PCO31110_04730 [Pandoraea communis]
MTDFDALSDPEKLEALLAAGIAASEQNADEQALECYVKAAELAPHDARAFHLAAAVWAKHGNTDAANDAFREALLRAPDLHVARFQWGLMQYSETTMPMAAATWEPLLHLSEDDPDDPLRLFVHGLLLVASGDIATAIAQIESGIAANTTNAPLNVDMAAIVDGLRPLLDSAAATQSEPAESQTSEGEHFLLGAYRGPDQPLH